jgi:hypothetical protein
MVGWTAGSESSISNNNDDPTARQIHRYYQNNKDIVNFKFFLYPTLTYRDVVEICMISTTP